MGAVIAHPKAIEDRTFPSAVTDLCTQDLAVSGASIDDTEPGRRRRSLKEYHPLRRTLPGGSRRARTLEERNH